MKTKDIVNLNEVNFDVSKLASESNTGSCGVHVKGGVNIYFILCQSIGPCLSCVCSSVCVISNQSTSKNHVICFKRHTARCCCYKGAWPCKV